MIDHITLVVANLERSRAFYEKALAPLGVTTLMQFPGVAGLGKDQKPSFWLGERPGQSLAPTHIAFAADTQEQVAAFYKAALAAGATDNGPPGLRPQYHPNYYAAFVVDPEGNNIEAVCHCSQASAPAAPGE